MKSEIGSQPTMCQVHTGTYIALLAPEKTTTPLATQRRLPRAYILHVVPITTHTHVRLKLIGKSKRKEKTETPLEPPNPSLY